MRGMLLNNSITPDQGVSTLVEPLAPWIIFLSIELFKDIPLIFEEFLKVGDICCNLKL
jgi:hypothetical protein